MIYLLFMIFLIKNVTILNEYICTKVSQIGFDVTIEMAFVNFYCSNYYTTFWNGGLKCKNILVHVVDITHIIYQ